jgi:hypothetical protein
MAEIAKGRIQFDGVWRVQNWLSLNTWVVARYLKKHTGSHIANSVEMVTVDPERPSSPVRVFVDFDEARDAADRYNMLANGEIDRVR